jgi:transcriptional regulator with GAF, ATPase, and Fis domain
VRRAVARVPCAPAPTDQPPAAPGGAPTVVLDPKMVELCEMLGRLARGTISVLILGDTGVGKEVAAETLHRASLRSAQAFVKVNCAALAEPLLESELFGHERGAFTGAVAAKQGLLELADGGTFFLDEVGELSAALQAKLLRVLETGELMRVGGSRARRVDVRFVAATNRDLSAAVAAGTFRADLLYRLSGASVRVPALRERTGEILPLAEAFVARAAAELGRPAPLLSQEAREQLLAYDFPGNVRELKNAVERALLLCSGTTLTGKDLSLGGHAWGVSTPCPAPTEVRDAARPGDERGSLSEKERIVGALLKHGGNQTRAARDLGLPRRTLVRRIAELGIPRPRDDT